MALSGPPQHHASLAHRTITVFPSIISQLSHRFLRLYSVTSLPLSSTSSFLCFARRRHRPFPSPSKQTKRKNKTSSIGEDDPEDDAFEALFRQLEHDLANDDQLSDDDDDISESDLAKLELELKGALAAEDDDLSTLSSPTDTGANGGGEGLMEEFTDDEEEDDEQKESIQLKGWQLRRLAYALKKGRRKTSIKSLAAELCLDRGLVIELLRDPPPNLLMMSASLPDEPQPVVSISETVEEESISSDAKDEPTEPNPAVKPPVHVLQATWSAKKRLKKVHVATLERVYERSKRPTNAMISSIVHLTNLPRKRIVKWFEDKRAADGLPEHHLPHRWVASESVFSQ